MANEAQARHWSEVAPGWLASASRRTLIGGGLGRLAMERLDLQPGEQVLDIGCGSGTTTLELAELVAPGGRAVGVDLAPEMIEYARSLDAPDAVEFAEADVQTADLGEHRFDAAYSRFGVMFFDDPVAAFANVRRSLRPGGRLSFVCWQSATANDWLLLPAAIATKIVGVPLPNFDSPAPGPFAFSDRERVQRILTDAGFRDVEVTESNDELLIPEGEVDDFVDGTVKGGHGVAEVLSDATTTIREQVRSELGAAISATVRDGQARLARGGYVAYGLA